MPTDSKIDLAKAVVALNSAGGGEGGTTPKTEPPVTVTSDHMRKFNQLVAFAKEKGFAGKDELDHNEKLRQKVFDEYNKAYPKDQISISMVKPIQNEIQAYKQKALEAIKSGVGVFAEGTTPDNFMKNISQVDGVFGKLTSQFSFPSAYLIYKQTAEKKNLGFAPKVDMATAVAATK